MPDPPVLLVVDDDPRGRGVVEGELRKRYGADYQVICARSGDELLSLLARLRDDRRLVSIVMASQGISGDDWDEVAGPGPGVPSGGQVPPADRLGIRTAFRSGPAGHRA